MNTSSATTLAKEPDVDTAIDAALQSIAPTWPLDSMIAVNPYWGYIDRPFSETASTLARVAGSPMAQATSEYRKAWTSGEISQEALDQAKFELASTLTAEQLIRALDEADLYPTPAPLLADSLDGQRDLSRQPAWCDTITHQIAQFCAAYFDHDQSNWRPDQSASLYASWRDSLTRDHSVALLMKASDIPGKATRLALEPREQICQSLAQLDLPDEAIPAYLQAVLMRISGWAAWCAYLSFQAALAGGEDSTLVELLAIRLSWESLLDDGDRHEGSVWFHWRSAWNAHFEKQDDPSVQVNLLWQRAREISYQNRLISKLQESSNATKAARPDVQAAFCIDVRSEVFRRHLEAQSDGIQTLGFAGFFGLPIQYQPLGSDANRIQLPGLLSPALTVTDSTGDPSLDEKLASQRQSKLRASAGWRTFQALPLSAFMLVESLGLGYVGKLIKRTLPSTGKLSPDTRLGLNEKEAANLAPILDAQAAGGSDQLATLAHQILTGMGLTGNFARLVLLVGHGSQTRNNPHRAGLDCGACCGQRGEVNARTLARMLQDPEVRRGIRHLGIDIPDSTQFLGGLHNTTTDEVELYGCEALPSSHAQDLASLQSQLDGARTNACAERALRMDVQGLTDQPEALSRAVRERANDWAQTRPEWGLANNAAFVVAPRSRTRPVNLDGRSFLHDYDFRKDPEGALLEQIMTAPMIVTNWINMQYFASTVDNHRFGSGNKTLHNVVGGRLGVFEGNGGDLRIGLPMQSLHDGDDWQHAALRLTVVIEAPQAMIDAVIQKHQTVRQLIDHEWLHLVRLDGSQAERYRGGQWQSV